MRPKLKYGLILSLILLIGVFAIGALSSRKKSQWDEEFAKTGPAAAVKAIEQQMAPCEQGNAEECNKVMERMEQDMNNAKLFSIGFDYCKSQLGKSPEECKKLVDQVHFDEEMKAQRENVSPLHQAEESVSE